MINTKSDSTCKSIIPNVNKIMKPLNLNINHTGLDFEMYLQMSATVIKSKLSNRKRTTYYDNVYNTVKTIWFYIYSINVQRFWDAIVQMFQSRFVKEYIVAINICHVSFDQLV